MTLFSRSANSDSGRPRRSRLFTSGFGTVLQEERQLHTAIGSGIECATGLGSQKIVAVLRQHARRVAGIASSLETRYRTLPAPDRFLALNRSGSSIFRLTRLNRLPLADPLIRLTAQHEVLIRRLESIMARDLHRRPPDIFSEAVHQHREMVWRLGNLLHSPNDDNTRDGSHHDELDP